MRERPDHADLVDVEADAACLVAVDAEQPQCFHQVQVALAGGDDAVAGFREVVNLAVDRVRFRKRHDGRLFSLHAFLDLRSGEVGPADVQAVRRRREVTRRDEPRRWRQLDRHCRFDGLGNRLETNPHSRKARQRNAIQAVLEVFGNIGRVQDGHEPRQERDIGLVRHRRRDAAVIITRDHQHAAIGRTAVRVAVFQCIAGPVEARSLAVPDTEYPIRRLAGFRFDLLRPEYGGGGEVLIDGGQELDVFPVKQVLRAPQLDVVAAERGTAVTADEPGRIEAGRTVQFPLHQRDPHQRLRAGQEDAARVAAITVEQFVVVERRVR